MGKSITELQFKDEALPQQDLADLPEFGRFTPPPPPGAYRFKLPKDLSQSFDLIDAMVPDPKDPSQKKPAQRLVMLFDDEHPLMIVSSFNGEHVNEPFNTRLNGAERNRGRGVIASDLDYLVKAFGDVTRQSDLRKQALRIREITSGKEFSANISYSWHCNPAKPIYVRKEGQLEKVENQNGCDQRYYEKDVPKNPDGSTPYEIQCGSCGAAVRAFANLDNIRA